MTPAVLLVGSSLVLGVTTTEDVSATTHHTQKEKSITYLIRFDLLLVVKL